MTEELACSVVENFRRYSSQQEIVSSITFEIFDQDCIPFQMVLREAAYRVELFDYSQLKCSGLMIQEMACALRDASFRSPTGLLF